MILIVSWLSSAVKMSLLVLVLVLEVDDLIAGRLIIPISDQCLSSRFLKVLTVEELITSAGSQTGLN